MRPGVFKMNGLPTALCFSVEKPFCKYTIQCVETNPFHFQQGAFHFETPLISTEGSVRSNGPVTWDYDGKRVFGQGCADGQNSITASTCMQEKCGFVFLISRYYWTNP